MTKLLSFFKPYRREMLLLSLLLFGRAMSELALPQYMAKIINEGILVGNLSTIATTGMLMLLISLVGISFAIGGNFFATKVAAASSRDMRSALFQRVTSLSPFELEEFTTASLITRTTNDIQMIQQASMSLLRIAWYSLIMGIGAVIKAVETSPSMTWTIGLALLTILVIMGVVFVFVFSKFERVQKLLDRLNAVMGEQLSGLPVIRAFNTQNHEIHRFDQSNRELMSINIFINRFMAFLIPALMAIMSLTNVLILWVGSHRIEAGDFLIGDMMAYLQYSMQVIMSFLFITMIFIMLPRALVSAKRIEAVLQTHSQIIDPETQTAKEDDRETGGKIRGEIRFDQVSFSYQGADLPALCDISFCAKPGTITGIIGSTGSGKSTLLHLLPRFFDATRGTITIDGRDIREFSLHQLRETISFVPQKSLLFSGTVKSNVAYGKERASQSDIDQALAISQSQSFVQAFDQGEDTSVSQGGTSVSGGQRQRLAIARALVKESPIYLFDDSFSALDFRTDAQLRQALKEAKAQATTLIVSQRIHTIMNADQIIVLEEGKMVGIGDHQSLMERCPTYYRIAQSQLENTAPKTNWEANTTDFKEEPHHD